MGAGIIDAQWHREKSSITSSSLILSCSVNRIVQNIDSKTTQK
jgi:hypothetical protein